MATIQVLYGQEYVVNILYWHMRGSSGGILLCSVYIWRNPV